MCRTRSQNGAEIRDHCMVVADPSGQERTASPASAISIGDGREHFQKAKAVIVSGYAIETPRLLLNSACPGFENGLANSSGTVGPLSDGAGRQRRPRPLR